MHRGRLVYLFRSGIDVPERVLAHPFVFPVRRSTAALVILADDSDAKVRDIRSRSLTTERPGRHTIAIDLERLMARIRKVREAGYAWTAERTGWNVIAPLCDEDRAVGVSLFGHRRRARSRLIRECLRRPSGMDSGTRIF